MERETRNVTSGANPRKKKNLLCPGPACGHRRGQKAQKKKAPGVEKDEGQLGN